MVIYFITSPAFLFSVLNTISCRSGLSQLACSIRADQSEFIFETKPCKVFLNVSFSNFGLNLSNLFISLRVEKKAKLVPDL